MSDKCSACGKKLSFYWSSFCGNYLCKECQKRQKSIEAEEEKQVILNGKLFFKNSRRAKSKLTEHCPNCSSLEKTDLPPLRTSTVPGFGGSRFLFPSHDLFSINYKCAKCGYLWCVPRHLGWLLLLVFSAVLGLMLLLFIGSSITDYLSSVHKQPHPLLMFVILGIPFVFCSSVIISGCRVMYLHTKDAAMRPVFIIIALIILIFIFWPRTCPKCNGDSSKWLMDKCYVCKNTGSVFCWTNKCPECNGDSPKWFMDKCSRCNNTGQVRILN